MAKNEKTKEKVSDQIKNEFVKAHYYRDTKRAVLGGVISGLADFTGWDVTLLRVLFVLLCFFTAFMPFLIAYVVVWICAPDDSSIPSKSKSTKSAAIKSNSDDNSDTSKPQNTTNLALRIILMIFGIIGFLTFIPILIALIPITIITIVAIASATIIEPPLFIATTILAGLLIFTIVSVGLQVSTALVTARFTKQAVIGFVTGIIFVIAFAAAATTTGIIWTRRVGQEGVKDTLNSISDDMHINVHINDNEDSDHRVRVDVGPIHVRTD